MCRKSRSALASIGILAWFAAWVSFAEAQQFFPRRDFELRGPKTLMEWVNANEGTGGEAAVFGERIITDRPHVAEAASLVGLGRVQVETGYTFSQDRDIGSSVQIHSFPEPLFRIGMFREWFEFRFAYNYLIQQTNDISGRTVLGGSDDITLGAKIALAEQSGIFPQLAIFPQIIVPSGSPAFTAGQVLPDINFAYAWEITEKLELECNTRVFGRREVDFDHSYVEIRQLVNFEYNLSEKWMAFNEFIIISPSGAIDVAPKYYEHVGLHYFITPNLQLDVHAAVGLNRAAADFFGGSGLSRRW